MSESDGAHALFARCVARYPEGHMDNPSQEDDFLRFKEKVEAPTEAGGAGRRSARSVSL